MGMEIRRVPPDWQHPRYTKDNAERPEQVGKLIPTCDNDYESASEEWMAELDLWRAGNHPDQVDYCKYYWEWAGAPPDEISYRQRKWTAEEATHFQVYETVSEGKPITPAFATEAELVDHLVNSGTDWDDEPKGWPRDNAKKFVEHQHAFSMVKHPGEGIKQVRDPGFFK